MTEMHPFGTFVPRKAKYFFLGSFPGKMVAGYDWFFASKRNQFWPILEEIYGQKFPGRKEKEKLFSKLNMAITDIILSCERRLNSNLDTNLINIVFNTDAVWEVFENNRIEIVYFSSRFVENLFRRNFKEIIKKYPGLKLITLPSPSPRFARMTMIEKLEIYRRVLPKLVKLDGNGEIL